MTAIPGRVLERIRGRAVEAYPEECCGFLLGSIGSDVVTVLEERPTENVAEDEDRRREFVVEPRALLDLTRELRSRDEELVGFYHSHPDHPAELSSTDMKFARLWPETMWLIVPVEGGSAGRERAWWLPAREAGATPSELTINDAMIGPDIGLEKAAADAAPSSVDRAFTPRGDRA